LSKVAILECGAQYTKVIDRRVREREVQSEVFPLDVEAGRLEGCRGIIISGGPHSVYEGRIEYDPAIFDLGVPILGICYGMQLICQQFDGRVEGIDSREYGETDITVDPRVPLFHGLEEGQTVLMSHGDSVVHLPTGFEVIARSPTCVAGIRHNERPIYGLQFHPEVDLTANGGAMFDNFLFRICGCDRSFTLAYRLQEACDRVRGQVGDRHVLILVSGGVDSCVSYLILNRALRPEQVVAVHIDNGFMRRDESRTVVSTLRTLGYDNLEFIDAAARFRRATMGLDGRRIGPLERTADPEHKRALIGNEFYEVVRDFIGERGLDLDRTFIAQGTLRPDLIESGNPDVSQFASRIKTHHNDVDIIREQRKKDLIIETNRDLHKDEVRRLARELGLPPTIAERQPFPGPGLGVRILNRDRPPGAEYHEAAAAFARLAADLGLDAALTPTETVGVQGDGRTYRYLALLFDTDPYDWPRVRAAAKSLVDRSPDANRVGVVLTGQGSGQALHAFTCDLDEETVGLCREADAVVRDACDRHGVTGRTSQILSVLVPLNTTGDCRFSIGWRVFMTNDYMTGAAAPLGDTIPLACVEDVLAFVNDHPRLDMLIYDATSKPPATTEWQ